MSAALQEATKDDMAEKSSQSDSDIERHAEESLGKVASNGYIYIDWDGPDDPRHPLNRNIWVRIWCVFMMSMLNVSTTISSSIFGSGQRYVAEEFGVSNEITVLGTSLFVVGYIVGPPFFGPLSEKFGRKIPMSFGMILSAIFTLMPALGKNITTILIGRFFAGLFGVAPIAIFGGVNVDCWKPHERGLGMAFCLSLVFSGPLYGPPIGNFVASSHLGWRWNMWLMIIFSVSLALVELFLVPETYPPVVLSNIAKRKRKETGDNRIRCKFDDEGTNFKVLRQVYLIRPWRLMSTEPILFLVTLYQSFIYGVVYLFFQAFPIAFREDRGWSAGVSGLPFLGVAAGIFVGTGMMMVYNATRAKTLYARDNKQIVPERRLPMLILGGIMLPIAFFWFAWTANPNILWVSQVFAGGLFGCGGYLVFVQCFSYLIDCYAVVAASALSANGAARSLFGAGFPLFANGMYHNLGVPWATSLLGFLSILLVPVPVVFYFFGHKIRSWSKAPLT